MAQRKLDNLDRDVIAAQALGYGVRYGAYKADHPYTKDQPEEPEDLPKDVGACLYCGTLFSKKEKRHRRLYCSDECRAKYHNRRTSMMRSTRSQI